MHSPITKASPRDKGEMASHNEGQGCLPVMKENRTPRNEGEDISLMKLLLKKSMAILLLFLSILGLFILFLKFHYLRLALYIFMKFLNDQNNYSKYITDDLKFRKLIFAPKKK